jgi:uncharacterized membrane protein YfcA
MIDGATDLDLFSWAVIFTALALGGVLKGATGAGSPVIAVPVMAAFIDVRLAVILMAAPNLVTNSWQIVQYRHARLPDRFSLKFGLAGAFGAVVGTVILASVPQNALTIFVGVSVACYIVLRFMRPGFRLPMPLAHKLVWPLGAISGVLQGAAGISAPVSVSFLNALGISRDAFIVTVSSFFWAMAFVQIPTLFFVGLLTWDRMAISAAALIPLLLFMPVGNWIAARMSARAFDTVVLVLLAALAVRLIYTALT